MVNWLDPLPRRWRVYGFLTEVGNVTVTVAPNVAVEVNTMLAHEYCAALSTTFAPVRPKPVDAPISRSSSVELLLTGTSQVPTSSPRAGSSRLTLGLNVEAMAVCL